MIADERIIPIDIRSILRRLLPVVSPFRKRFAVGFVFICLSMAVEIVLPVILGWTVDAAIAPDKRRAVLLQLCTLYLCLIVVRAVLEGVQAYVIQATGESVTHRLRDILFAKIQSLPVSYFDKNPTGRLLTRVVNDIKSLSELFTASFSVLALDGMVILGTCVAMFLVDWRLALCVFLSFPAVILTIHHFGAQLAVAYRKVRRRLSEINAFLGENIGAIATIQRLRAERDRMEKFSGIVEAHFEAQMESLNVFARVQPITNTLNGLSMGILMAIGGYWVIKGEITIGVLVAFFGYIRNLFQPIRDLVEKYNTFLSSMMSAERIVGILNEKNEEEAGAPQSHTFLRPEECSISFRDVTFTYPMRRWPALGRVSFDLDAGKSLAVVGATGSGKSTLIRLLLRFYEPDSGEILFAGKPLREWGLADLRRQIGVIHQENFLFQGTVRENLCLGRADFSDDYLRSQCERAQLWPFIQARGGLDLQIHEGGSNLSLGERQLLAFARILVFDTKVLVLDEATASIDRALERRLMEAIREVIAGRTSIVIAHRLSTIRSCDKVVVIEHGAKVEEGTYDHLLHHNGLFAKFHEIHSRQ